MSSQDLYQGKKYLVTGATRGIGKAVTAKLHSLGAIVYALAKTPENLEALQKEFPKVIPICANLEDWDTTRSVVESLESVDCLINNAGFVFPRTFMEVQKDDFDSLVNLNLKAVVNVSQVIAQKMIDRGQGGTIVNISSIAGKDATNHIVPYSCAKAGLEMLTKIMAVELGPHKIRVNSVCPGLVDTELVQDYVNGVLASGKNLKDDIFFSKVTNRTPTQVTYMPMEDVVNTILFLGSNATSQISGESLVVDGGFLVG